MLGRIRLHDYRCFWREEPTTLELRTGFTSFIGPNNAGKSSLVKAAYELRPAIGQVVRLRHEPGSLLSSVLGWNLMPPLHEHAEILTDRDDPACVVELEPSLPDDQRARSVAQARLEFLPGGGNFHLKLYAADGRELGAPNSPTAIARHSKEQQLIEIAGGEEFDLKPICDFAEALHQVQYFGPFRNAINEGGGGHFDTQIGTGFIGQWHSWKTGPTKQHNRAVERVTEDVRRLIGAKTLEINASNELKTLQVVVDRRPHKLEELGAGFAQLVLVLGNALVRQPSFILIDEPESHLHPALQSDFLTTLATYARYGVLYTTHSMGLARLADSCFTVQRRSGRSVVRPFEKTPNYAEFLGSLGIAGLRELGWDRVLLVEGPKDVRTMQQLLRLYAKDRETIVLPLGGDSMVNGKVAHELSEVMRLCDRVCAVVDSERSSEAGGPIEARMQFAKVCSELGISCCVTERRAIENYISQRALDRVWGSGRFTALTAYDAPSKDGSFWGKGESWKAAARMTIEELESTDIGRFLLAM
jgi:ABC-type Mn2+/Zn2+ transport system ATPase subunit